MCIQLGVSIPLYLAAKDMYTMIADSNNISINRASLTGSPKMEATQMEIFNFL